MSAAAHERERERREREREEREMLRECLCVSCQMSVLSWMQQQSNTMAISLQQSLLLAVRSVTCVSLSLPELSLPEPANRGEGP